jgi:transcription elongation factor GreA
MKARLIKRFEDEIVQLERELNVELPKEIKRARELGDLRENAEYSAAKERQRFVEARVSMLRQRVAEIQLMNLDKIPHDRAAFGSTVHLTEDTGDKMVYQLVMPEEADAAKGTIANVLLKRRENNVATALAGRCHKRARIPPRQQRDKGSAPKDGGRCNGQGKTEPVHVRLTLRMSAAGTQA